MHLHDGPIDLVVEAFGAPREIEAAYRAAAARFVGVLDELCGELSFLRQATQVHGELPDGMVARRMVAAVAPFATSTFITPMAAVAGAVAEEILGAMTSAARLSRAYVNDGGDIALYLTQGETFRVGMVDRPLIDPYRYNVPNRNSLFGKATIGFDHPVRGIATSGWQGRSFSLGIADAVTVLANTAATADAAATMIANAVDLPGHPEIERARACDLAPENDLGERLVTRSVGRLSDYDRRVAIANGSDVAESMRKAGLIHAAAISLQAEIRIVDGERPTPMPFFSATGSFFHA
jgi:ApbE superfamily uncharacterized protein (UPF0280 family)